MENADRTLTEGWQFVGIVSEGEHIQVHGVDPWTAMPWTQTPGHITVAHPSYANERHTILTYLVDTPDGPVSFAAGEFSNGVWGFYARA
jgi:hypothetical protein